MTNLLCLIGLHAKLRDTSEVSYDARTTKFYCRRCSARWIRSWISAGEDSNYIWERTN